MRQALCSNCKTQPPLPPLASGKKRYYCRACERETHKRFYANNKERRNSQQYGRVRANKELLTQLKSLPCVDCGNTFPGCCMDFDHKDPKHKTANIAQLRSAPMDLLLQEIAKCELVCSNCHRIRTYERKQNNGHVERVFKNTQKLLNDSNIEIVRLFVENLEYRSDKQRSFYLASQLGVSAQEAKKLLKEYRKLAYSWA